VVEVPLNWLNVCDPLIAKMGVPAGPLALALIPSSISLTALFHYLKVACSGQ
jgi:hypothetical protein